MRTSIILPLSLIYAVQYYLTIMTLLGNKAHEIIILAAWTWHPVSPHYLSVFPALVTTLLLSAYELTFVGCNLREIWKYLTSYAHNVIPQIKSHIILFFFLINSQPFSLKTCIPFVFSCFIVGAVWENDCTEFLFFKWNNMCEFKTRNLQDKHPIQ